MELKKLNTAQALLSHIALKTEHLALFGAEVLVREWTASERIKYLALVTESKDEGDELDLLRPQAQVVAFSMVDNKGKQLITKAEDIEALVQNRAQETSEAFVEISKFNGLMFNNDHEEDAAKN